MAAPTTGGDVLASAHALLDQVDEGARTTILDLIAAVESARAERGAIAEWLRARAELAASAKPDPEQPGSEDFFAGSRAGSYNSLYLAANAVEDGRAALPRDRWPPYMRREARPSSATEPTETSDAPASPAA